MHGEPIALLAALLHGRFELAEEQDPIGEVGQSVAMRQMPDPRLGASLRRDVLVDRNRSPVRHRPAAYGEDSSVAQVVDDVAGLRQKRLPEAVRDIFLDVLRRRAGRDASLENGTKRGPGLRLLGAETVHFTVERVGQDDLAVGADHAQAVRHVGHRRLQQHIGAGQLGRGGGEPAFPRGAETDADGDGDPQRDGDPDVDMGIVRSELEYFGL